MKRIIIMLVLCFGLLATSVASASAACCMNMAPQSMSNMSGDEPCHGMNDDQQQTDKQNCQGHDCQSCFKAHVMQLPKQNLKVAFDTPDFLQQSLVSLQVPPLYHPPKHIS